MIQSAQQLVKAADSQEITVSQSHREAIEAMDSSLSLSVADAAVIEQFWNLPESKSILFENMKNPVPASPPCIYITTTTTTSIIVAIVATHTPPFSTYAYTPTCNHTLPHTPASGPCITQKDWMLDQTHFYMSNAARISAPDFTPNDIDDHDIIATRVLTVGTKVTCRWAVSRPPMANPHSEPHVCWTGRRLPRQS